MHRNILGKVGEQRAEVMKVIPRTILLDWVNRKRIRRKRELTIMQYRQGTNPHTFLSVVDLDCCWIKWERIDRTPQSCFSFVLRLCGVCEWTGPQGNSQRYLWSEQLLGGTKTGSTTTIHWYNYYYYLLPNMKLFKIIDLFVCLFFDSRLLGAQTSKGKLKKKNLLYHFRQEKQNANESKTPTTMCGIALRLYMPGSICSDSISNHIHGNRAHYVISTSVGVDNLDRYVLGILPLIFFIIFFLEL